MKKTTAKNNKSTWLPLALALAVNLVLPQAFAADAIRIPAQPLGQALSQLGQQTSLQVFFSPELVAGKQAPAVEGNIAPEEALRQLLQGSGLQYQIDEGSVTLLPAPAAAANGPLELGVTDIKVVGDWLGDADAAVVQNHPGARTVIRREAMVEQGAMNVGDVLKRVRAGLAHARRQGRIGGRPRLVVDRDKVRELHEGGQTMREIAAAMGISAAAVCRIVQAT